MIFPVCVVIQVVKARYPLREADDLSIALLRLTADKRVKQGIYSSNFFIFWLSSRVLQGSFYSIKIGPIPDFGT